MQRNISPIQQPTQRLPAVAGVGVEKLFVLLRPATPQLPLSESSYLHCDTQHKGDTHWTNLVSYIHNTGNGSYNPAPNCND